MPGIRRITANNNPMLGDDGSRLLADALKDDLWLKALDLQACGVSSAGAQSFLEVLKYNTTLVVLDLRRNPLIDRDVMHSLMEQLMLNSNGEDGEYKWTKAEGPEDSTSKQTVRTRRRATKVLNSSLGKKTTIKVSQPSSRRRPRVTGGVTRRADVLRSPGLPWRTALRANRFRGHPPEVSKFVNDQSVDATSSSILVTSGSGKHLLADYNNHHDDDDDDDDSMTATTSAVADVVVTGEYGGGSGGSGKLVRIRAEADAAMRKLEESHLSLDLNNQKDVKVELEQMRRHLREERLARAQADHRVMQLMMENRQLTQEVTRLRSAGTGSGSAVMEDENFLRSIETSFKQFHAFIDMLREAGLEQLVTMAGLDQSQMPFN
ncbi:centrosomal protein of 78 kDa, partial [Aplysia californica]|uniref:Centrosomal protein of 78 kDa n=1 Tax=Aplysia californica TaxID=6500 RepID=A0ABM1A7Q6_APLCA